MGSEILWLRYCLATFFIKAWFVHIFRVCSQFELEIEYSRFEFRYASVMANMLLSFFNMVFLTLASSTLCKFN